MFVREENLEIIQESHNKGWLNKLCYSHTMGSCAAIKKKKKNEEAVLVLIWKDFRDRLSVKKKKKQGPERVYVLLM